MEFTTSYSIADSKARLVKAVNDKDFYIRSLYLNESGYGFEIWSNFTPKNAASSVRIYELQGSLKKQPDNSTKVNIQWRISKSSVLMFPIMIVGGAIIGFATSPGRMSLSSLPYVVAIGLIFIAIVMIMGRYQLINIVKKSLADHR